MFSVAAADNQQHVWVGSSDAGIYQLNVDEEKPERIAFEGEGHSSYVTGIVRCENQILSVGYDRKLIWWDIEEKKAVREVIAHDRWIRRIILTPDNSHVVTVADDMRCRVWDIASGNQVADFSDHQETTPHHYPSMLYAVAISRDGRRVATGDRVGHVAIWDTATWEKVGELETPIMYTWDPKQRRHSIGGIRSLAFSSDGKRLAVGGIGKIGNIDHLGGPARLEVFDIQSGDRLHEIEDNKKKGLIEQIAWSPDDQWILTAGGDHKGFLTIYDSESGKVLLQADEGDHIHQLCYDPTFEHIFVAGHKRLSRWAIVTA